ncbi:hypothetical protein J4734_21445 [Klebsiella pneumoniae]|uniref:Tetrapyrrole methylase domain-containing protein n=1 Tax=Klebsiella pneumoniae TaxID=573 RepID=A0A939NRG8_KLEPN|nr:hypothetical protein [Klebsiella pneumoniae]
MRAARILGQLDVLYAPAGRKTGALHRTRVLGAHGGPLLPFSDERRQRGKRGGVERRCRGAGPEVAAGRQVGFITLGDAMLFSFGSFCCSGLAAQVAGDCPGVTSFAAIAARAKTRWPWSSSRWRLSPAPRRKRTLPRRCASMTVWY